MSRLEAMLSAYRALGGPAYQTDTSASEYPSLVKELTEVMEAKSDRRAGDAIRWWDCWDGPRGSSNTSATTFARRFRRLVTELEEIQ